MPSAKEKVAAELRKAILSRQMKEGEILSLDSVASQLNVSAMPVREAFQILARDGLIQLRKNKGAVVLGITETYIREHYQLRAILESAAAKLAAEPGTCGKTGTGKAAKSGYAPAKRHNNRPAWDAGRSSPNKPDGTTARRPSPRPGYHGAGGRSPSGRRVGRDFRSKRRR